MTNRPARAIGLLLAVSLLFAACGSEDDDTASSEDETRTTEVAEATTDPSATEAPAEAPVGVDASGELPTEAPDTVDPDELTSEGFGYRVVEFRDQLLDRQAEFERLDINGDGFLVADEYNGTAKLFGDMDVDDDDKLSPEETEFMMVFADIPSGDFIMGTDEPVQAFVEPEVDAGPAHEVTIDAFKMAATEITTAQYVLYLNSALEAAEITVFLGEVHDDVERFHYPIATYLVEGAPGTEYKGLPYIDLAPVTGLSHKRFEDNTLLIPEHPLNES